MTTSRPEQRQIAELRRSAHRELDTIFDAWPAIIDMAATITNSHQPTSDADLIRGQGGHSDPTLNQALNITASNTWRRDFVRLCNHLQLLAARAANIIGDLPDDACHICRHYLDDGRPLHKADGRTVHRPCYDLRRTR